MGGLIKPGLMLVSLIIGLFSWPYIARIIRGQVLSLREKEFIEASRSLGSSNFRIIMREILPNVAAPIIVFTTLIIPSNILFEAAPVVPGRRRAATPRPRGGPCSPTPEMRSRTRRGS